MFQLPAERQGDCCMKLSPSECSASLILSLRATCWLCVRLACNSVLCVWWLLPTQEKKAVQKKNVTAEFDLKELRSRVASSGATQVH